MTPNPKYVPLTEAQFKNKQWATYLAGNPDVKATYGNNADAAWEHYSSAGIDEIFSGFRTFNAPTPTLIREVGVQYPVEFGLIDKTGKVTPTFLKNAPEAARSYIIDNYALHDADKKTFNQSDLNLLKTYGITNPEDIGRIAQDFGTEQMDLAAASLLRKNEVLSDPVKYKLIDPKTEKHTPAFLQFFPEEAAKYVAENYASKYDANKGDFTQADVNVLLQAKLSDDQIRSVMGNYGLGSIADAVAQKYIPEQRKAGISPETYKQFYDTRAAATPAQASAGTEGVFDANDLAFLRAQKVPPEQIDAIARSYGVDKIAPALLKYDAKNKTYATPELANLAGDIFANYGKFELGEKGIFDIADVALLKSLGYTDADITSRAKTLFGEDRLSASVIQQYFPGLALKKPESLYLEGPLQYDRTPQTQRPEAPTPQYGITAPTVGAPSTQAPVAPTVPETDYYSFFRGIPGPSDVAAAPAPVITGQAPKSPIVEYFANTPIASPFPTLPYRFQTLTPENVNLRQGLGTLPTSTPLIQAPSAAPAQFATPAAAPTISTPFAPTPFGLNIPTTQYIGPAPTVAQLQALQDRANVQLPPNSQGFPAPITAVGQERPNVPILSAPTAAQIQEALAAQQAGEAVAPVAGRMGGMVSFAEGGMPKLTPAEAGSQVNVQDYIDPKTGRFYINEFKRDEVFGSELRDAEAAKRRLYEQDPLLQAEEAGLVDRQRKADTLMYDYGIRRPRPFGYAEGGEVQQTYGLQNAAQQLQQLGRGGDTILAHINPEEAGILQLLGGSGTINPYTGLYEFNLLKKAGDAIGRGVKKVGDALGRAANKIAEGLGPVGQIAAAYFGGPIGAAVYAGFAAPGQKFDFKQAGKAGALTYGANVVGGVENPMGPAYDWSGGAGAATGTDASVNLFGPEAAGAADAAAQTGQIAASDVSTLAPPPTVPSVDASALDVSQVNALSGPVSNTTATGPAFDFTPSGEAIPVGAGSVPVSPGAAGSTAGAADVGEVLGTTAKSGAQPVDTRSLFRKGLDAITPTVDLSSASGIASTAKDLAMTGYLASSAVAAKEAMDEQEKYEEEQRRLKEEQRRREREYSDLFSRTLGRVPMAAGGGIVALANGGMPTFEYGGTTAPTGEPRMVQGAGDGMSDNVPATIEGVQEARLANDEFVVPADVVADIGNGSSNAGAKKLYAMMDRVRKARHGTVKQPPEIRAERFMPA